jgi:hypothetical protein
VLKRTVRVVGVPRSRAVAGRISALPASRPTRARPRPAARGLAETGRPARGHRTPRRARASACTTPRAARARPGRTGYAVAAQWDRTDRGGRARGAGHSTSREVVSGERREARPVSRPP